MEEGERDKREGAKDTKRHIGKVWHKVVKAETGVTSERENSRAARSYSSSCDKRRTMATEKVGKILKDIYYDQFKWSVVKNIAFFLIGVKIAVECNGMTIMPPVSV